MHKLISTEPRMSLAARLSLSIQRKRDVLAVSTVEGDLRDRAVCVHDLFKWTRPVATSAYVTFAEC